LMPMIHDSNTGAVIPDQIEIPMTDRPEMGMAGQNRILVEALNSEAIRRLSGNPNGTWSLTDDGQDLEYRRHPGSSVVTRLVMAPYVASRGTGAGNLRPQFAGHESTIFPAGWEEPTACVINSMGAIPGRIVPVDHRELTEDVQDRMMRTSWFDEVEFVDGGRVRFVAFRDARTGRWLWRAVVGDRHPSSGFWLFG